MFFENFKVNQMNCGTTEGMLAGVISATSNPVDMSSYEGAAFIATIEKVCGSSAPYIMLMYSCSSGGTFHDVAGTAVQYGTSATNYYLASEIYKPLPDQRWWAPKVISTVANTCIWVGSLIGIQYNARNMPVTQATCNYHEVAISATSGTA
jgi:hypothetical protein